MTKRRNFLITVLTAIAIFTFAVSALIGVAVPTKATNYSDTTGTFYMEKGAAIYLNPNEVDANGDILSGVKFRAYVPENGTETTNTYGMLIVPYDYFARASLTVADTTDYVNAFKTAHTDGLIKSAATVYTGLQVKTENNSDYFVEYSIADIKANNYDRNWFGVAFSVTGEEGAESYTYATLNDNIRSVEYVASGALNDLTYDAYNLPDDTLTLYQTVKSDLENIVDTAVKNVVGESGTVTYQLNGEETMLVDQEEILTVSVTQGVNVKTFWTTSDASKATVDASGKVTAISVGEVTVTASSVIGAEKVLESSLTINVKPYDTKDKSIIKETGFDSVNVSRQLVDGGYDESSLTSLKIVYTKAEAGRPAGNKNRGMFLYYASDFTTDLFDLTAESFADNLYVGFYIKLDKVMTSGNMDLAVRMNNYNGTTWTSLYGMDMGGYNAHKAVANSSEWNYMEFCVTDLITDLFRTGVTQYRFSLNFEINSNDTLTFYIDEINLFTKSDHELIVDQVSSTSNYVLTSNEDLSYVYKAGADDKSIKVVYTQNNIGRAQSHVIADDAGRWFSIIGADNENIDWSNVYLGFWLYFVNNGSRLNLQLQVQNAVTIDGAYSWSGSASSDFGGYYNNKDIYASSGDKWQYVEWKLNDLYKERGGDKITLHTENVTNFRFWLNNETADGTTSTFYLDEIRVYSKDGDNYLATNKSSHSDFAVGVNTNSDYVHSSSTDGTSLKFVFTNNGSNRRLVISDSDGLQYDFTKDVTDWSNAYLGFWLYLVPSEQSTERLNLVLNACTYKLEDDGVTYTKTGGSNYLDYFGYYSNKDVYQSSAGQWLYVEWALTGLKSLDSALATENVDKFTFGITNETTGATVTFYIDGLAVYTGSRK